MPNDLEKQKLKRDRSDLSLDRLERLDALLLAFRNSMHYEMLSTVHLVQFVENPTLLVDAISQTTFEELAERTASELVLETELSPEGVEQLIAVFERFVGFMLEESYEKPESLVVNTRQAHAPEDQIVVQTLQRRPSREVPVLSSIEVAKRLQALFDQLRIHPLLPQNGNRHLSDYWEKETLRAPFLEELSLREICHFQVDTLLKKRSVTPQKAVLLIEALERAVNSFGALPTESSGASSSLLAVPIVDRNLPEKWQECLDGSWNCGELALLYTLHIERQLTPLRNDPLNRLLYALCNMKGEEILGTFLPRKDEVGPSLEVSQELLRSTIPEAFEFWKGQLRQVGVSAEQLFAPFDSSSLSQCVAQILREFILRSFGAVHPRFESEEFLSLWTCSPDAFSRVIDMIGRESDPSKQESDVDSLLPHFDRTRILQIIRRS